MRVDGFASPSLVVGDRSGNLPADGVAPPPIFVAHGDDDTAVRVEWARSLVDRLAAAGDDVELRIYPADHMGVGDAARARRRGAHPRRLQ